MTENLDAAKLGRLGRIVSLHPTTRNGTNKVAAVKRRFPRWDGRTWRVKAERQAVSFSNRSGPWALVEPAVDGYTALLNRWISLTDDADFNVQANA